MFQNIMSNNIAAVIGLSLIINSVVILCSTYFIYQQKLNIKCDCGSDEITENEYSSRPRTEIPFKLINHLKNEIGNPSVLTIVQRDEWLGQPPVDNIESFNLPPIKKVVIAHTATENCTTRAQCSFRVRFIQTFHMESRTFSDIAYNFLIGGNGEIYEGRGWDKQPACTKGFNVDTICIGFIGTFGQISPTNEQIRSAELLLERGVKLEKLTEDYKLFGHRQLVPSDSPGEKLYEIIKSWPHFSIQLE